MKKLLTACVLLAAASGAQALPMHYFGEILGSGSYAGTVTSNDSWANPGFGLNQFGEQQLNLWGFDATAGQTLSVGVSSTDDFNGGFSLYYGEISNFDLLAGLFNNSGDIGAASYVAGTSIFGLDSLLSDISLQDAGFYTLIVGGKGPVGDAASYNYMMDVQMSSVPVASSLLLMSAGLLNVVVLRRRTRKQHEQRDHLLEA
ncbi:hypothetical protein [Kineobactrum salinum]|uniref:PEP-CTERM sorting domain-containing protein n=1 Tax=Kineobactrum salinum TaxID=2708301 RepID=A0A6C0TYL0_9GAMM|nr:hypothetical protein [Kineobactrum salinum]QIB64891.1 hypothetical protein G3T16_05285 [Kineobactrum salinum]